MAIKKNVHFLLFFSLFGEFVVNAMGRREVVFLAATLGRRASPVLSICADFRQEMALKESFESKEDAGLASGNRKLLLCLNTA